MPVFLGCFRNQIVVEVFCSLYSLRYQYSVVLKDLLCFPAHSIMQEDITDALHLIGGVQRKESS